MNASLLIPPESTPLPSRVTVDWRRFSSGLWRLPEGDIQAAYCADILPNVKVFRDEGRLLANCGAHFSGPVRAEADCYPLIPSLEYRGPDSRRYSYEGSEVSYQREAFRLGPKVVFQASDPDVDTWRRLFRVLYADGGMFAHGVTYLEFLKQRLSPKSENERAAHLELLAGCGLTTMPRTQTEMRQLLDGEIANINRPAAQQLDFSL